MTMDLGGGPCMCAHAHCHVQCFFTEHTRACVAHTTCALNANSLNPHWGCDVGLTLRKRRLCRSAIRAELNSLKLSGTTTCLHE